MKKLISVLLGSCFLLVIACGPSAEEKAAADKAVQDSIRAALQKHLDDSVATAEATRKAIEDSTRLAHERDSLAAALEESQKKVAKATKPKSTTTPKQEQPKVGKKKPGMN